MKVREKKSGPTNALTSPKKLLVKIDNYMVIELVNKSSKSLLSKLGKTQISSV